MLLSKTQRGVTGEEDGTAAAGLREERKMCYLL